MNREKVIVIGTEKEAECFLYQRRDEYEAVLFVDKKPRKNVFRGKSVISYDEILYELNPGISYKIVVATTIEEYVEICKDLRERRLLEFEDFIFHEAIGKKIAIFYGNCQVQDLKTYLKEIREFDDAWWLYPFPLVHDPGNRYIPESVFKRCDLFVYQNVKSESNGLLRSTEYMRSLLREDTIVIKVPNLYPKGYGWFPQSQTKKISFMREAEHAFVVNSTNQDAVIRMLYKQGLNLQQIVDEILHGDVWSKEEILEGFYKTMEQIKLEDESSDIKIYKWIEDNYKKDWIFVDCGHISDGIFKEYIIQLLKIMNIEITSDLDESMKCLEHKPLMPIYGCVARTLGFEYWNEEQKIKAGTFSLTGDAGLNIDEYVKQYIFMSVDSGTV